MGFRLTGKSTNSHVLLLSKASISKFIASTHLGSLEASLYVLGSTPLFKLLTKHAESADKQA
ncbi:hypothetical protein Hanom_Chr05g00448261 [Helianthus anomalus]